MIFQISSGPFNVPMVKHVVTLAGHDLKDLRRNWHTLLLALRNSVLHFNFVCLTEPGKSGKLHMHILLFTEFAADQLEAVCQKYGGELVA